MRHCEEDVTRLLHEDFGGLGLYLRQHKKVSIEGLLGYLCRWMLYHIHWVLMIQSSFLPDQGGLELFQDPVIESL